MRNIAAVMQLLHAALLRSYLIIILGYQLRQLAAQVNLLCIGDAPASSSEDLG